MPNGGSDCCGTCWFNRSNRGHPGYRRRDPAVRPHCEIRDLPINVPFYTYCVNHPYRRPDRDPIPIGPVLVHDGASRGRRIWKLSPDADRIRQHLLALLDELSRSPTTLEMQVSVSVKDGTRHPYSARPSLAEMVFWQLGDFKERGAIEALNRLVEEDHDLAPLARTALAQIQGDGTTDPMKKRF